MSLKLRIASGPDAGKEFTLKPGDTIGRGGGTINIDDPKASNKHVKIERDPSGAWILFDLGSTNGTRFNGKRIKQAILVPGSSFIIGKTTFFVHLAKAAKSDSPSTQGATTPPALVTKNISAKSAPGGQVTVEPEPPPAMDWSGYLSSFSAKATQKVQNHKVSLQPFSPLLVLKFIRGPQLGTEWILGYGPRSIGLATLDLPVFEEGAPLVCFTVRAQGQRVLFTTDHADKVLLNGKPTKAEVLKTNDRIDILNTAIAVSFKE